MFEEICAKNTDEVAGTDNMTAILVKLFNDNLPWIMQNIIKSLKKLNLSTIDLFDFINKDREGIVSRRDF